MLNYFVPIDLGRITAAVGPGVFWAMRAGPSGIVIREIIVTISCDVVNAAATTAVFGFYRFSGANFNGGNPIVPVKASSSQAASRVADVRSNAGAVLGNAGVVQEVYPFFTTINQRAPGATTTESHIWARGDGIVLNPGEGLCIRADVATVVGDGLAGYVSYEELQPVG